ncbi:MAG: chorismate synthase [Hyphomicrobiaceae bacterium]|nr:chorismate synthase [Hyphomicrobiaceae bacterium]
MSHNSFGHLFRLTTWGESHGPAIGCVIDGCPPGITFRVGNDIQSFLDKRRPGQSRFVTQRRELDLVKVLSGTLESNDGTHTTTGTPIALHIDNTDQRSKDYGNIAQSFRPDHADYTYFKKYGLRDHRGGGRSSARETACRVAGGAIARRVIEHLSPGARIRGALVQIGTRKIPAAQWGGNWSSDHINDNDFFCPDVDTAKAWTEDLDRVRKAGSSVGAAIEIIADNIPAGLGAPIYGKLDSDLASAMMSINAVKAVEIGDGMAVAELSGEANADEIRSGPNGQPQFLSNHAGGILGGISSGQSIICRFAVKPTSSILTPRRTIDETGADTEIITKGRHDPCVGIRAVPVGEAMMALVLADHLLRHRGQTGR